MRLYPHDWKCHVCGEEGVYEGYTWRNERICDACWVDYHMDIWHAVGVRRFDARGEIDEARLEAAGL